MDLTSGVLFRKKYAKSGLRPPKLFNYVVLFKKKYAKSGLRPPKLEINLIIFKNTIYF